MIFFFIRTLDILNGMLQKTVNSVAFPWKFILVSGYWMKSNSNSEQCWILGFWSFWLLLFHLMETWVLWCSIFSQDLERFYMEIGARMSKLLWLSLSQNFFPNFLAITLAPNTVLLHFVGMPICKTIWKILASKRYKLKNCIFVVQL